MLKAIHALLLLAVLGAQSFSACAADKVLIIVSGHGTADHQQPGYEFDEFAQTYSIFSDNGFDIDVASPAGGAVVADKFDSNKPYNARVLADKQAMAKLENTLSTRNVSADDYRALFVMGGKGAMFDLPVDKSLQALIARIHQNEGVVSAVCHGPAAFVDVRLDDGRYLVQGRRISGFTNEEEEFFSDGWKDKYPFLLEDRLIERGAIFEEALLMLPHVSINDRLITGQNPFSTIPVAEAVVRALGRQPVVRVPDAEERSMNLLSKVANGDVQWAKTELSQRHDAYQIPLIGIWGYYASMAAAEREDLQHAATVMELAMPYMKQPKLRLALARTYVKLGDDARARKLLTELAKAHPDMQEVNDMLSKLRS